MSVPRLEIYLDQDASICIAKVEHEGSDSRLLVNVALDELKSLGPEDAAHRVGGTVLNVIGLWHKNEFGDWKVPPTEEDTGSDEYDIALRLISLAMSAKTSEHNASIDLLLQHAATHSEEAKKYLEEAWPLLRDRLGN